MKKKLSYITETTIRFSEVDSMGIVWHGNYIHLFEDGRESFGRKYGLGYLDIYSNKVFTPIVKLNCDYKYPLRYGDVAIIESTFVDCEAAKIKFEYKIYRKSDNVLVCTGETIQVFLNEQQELMLTNPEFYTDWKKKWLEK